jgi:hypothetical protein
MQRQRAAGLCTERTRQQRLTAVGGGLTCGQTLEVQRQLVGAVGTVGVAVTLPLRAEEAASVPAAKLLRSTGAIDCKETETERQREEGEREEQEEEEVG